MKQNAEIIEPIKRKISHSDRKTNPSKPSDKQIFSPRLFTRKNERKDNLSNAFLRRKPSHEQIPTLKYLSPKSTINQNKTFADKDKTMMSQEQYSFLSNDNNFVHHRDSYEKSILELDFSRINAEKNMENVQGLFGAQNLFDDINCTSDNFVNKSLQNVSVEKQMIYFSQTEDNTDRSLETMSCGPQRKDNKIQDIKFLALVQGNDRLKKENQDFLLDNSRLKTQLQIWRQKSQQIQDYLNKKNQQINQILNRQSSHLLHISNLEEKINLSRTKINDLETQNKEQSKVIQAIEKNLYKSNTQLYDTKHEVKLLEEAIGQLRSHIQEKQDYSKCLQDVILELNQKIDSLRRQISQIYLQAEQKTDEADQLIDQLQHKSEKMRLYQQQIQVLNKRIDELTLITKAEQIPSNSPMCRSSVFPSPPTTPKKDSLEQNNSLVQQLSALHQLLDLEKVHNDQLRKQISYNVLELSLLKKGKYEHQKLAEQVQRMKQQVQTLKGRNKKLMKKVNELMEQNLQLRSMAQKTGSKVASSQKKPMQVAKRFQSTSLLDNNNNNTQLLLQKPAAQRVNNQHQSQQGGSGGSFKIVRRGDHGTALRFDSDDELSFKLSPDKR